MSETTRSGGLSSARTYCRNRSNAASKSAWLPLCSRTDATALSRVGRAAGAAVLLRPALEAVLLVRRVGCRRCRLARQTAQVEEVFLRRRTFPCSDRVRSASSKAVFPISTAAVPATMERQHRQPCAVRSATHAEVHGYRGILDDFAPRALHAAGGSADRTYPFRHRDEARTAGNSMPAPDLLLRRPPDSLVPRVRPGRPGRPGQARSRHEPRQDADSCRRRRGTADREAPPPTRPVAGAPARPRAGAPWPRAGPRTDPDPTGLP